MKDKKSIGYILGNVIAGIVACCAAAIIVATTYKIILWII